MFVRMGSASPTIVLRISDGTCHMHRSFSDFGQALRSAEAFSGAGFLVTMASATGQELMQFVPALRRPAVVGSARPVPMPSDRVMRA